MGDKITIPRSWADKLGIADVKDSLRRKILTLPVFPAGTTTGFILGNTTTAPKLFERNIIIEKMNLQFFLASTATTGTTLLSLILYKNASVAWTSKKINSTTQIATTGWQDKEETSFTITNFGASDRVALEVKTRTNAIDRLSVILTYKEALDT